MKLEAVDRHISTGSCPGAPQPQSQLQAPMSNGASKRDTQSGYFSSSRLKPKQSAKAPEHLPALNYSMLKDAALRKKLADLDISTYGSRRVLEQRHKEWVTLWNANCDAAHPKTRSELLRDLDTWERTMSSAARGSSSYGNHAAQPQVKDKDFDGASWATSHDSSFKDLIAKARHTKKQAEKKSSEASAPEMKQPDLPPKPAYGTVEPVEGDGQRRESNPMTVPYHSGDQVSGFDRAAGSGLPVMKDEIGPSQRAINGGNG